MERNKKVNKQKNVSDNKYHEKLNKPTKLFKDYTDPVPKHTHSHRAINKCEVDDRL